MFLGLGVSMALLALFDTVSSGILDAFRGPICSTTKLSYPAERDHKAQNPQISLLISYIV